MIKFIGIFRNHILFFILILVVIISQHFLLQQHLKYGLVDLDDGYIAEFHYFRDKYPNIIEFIIESYKNWGAIYLHQYYYVGILNYFFGSDFVTYHYVTHFFKIIATLSTYPLFFVLSGSSLVAFVSVILYAFSYSAAGALESVVQSSDYPAIIMLSLFLSIYFSWIKKNSENVGLLSLIIAEVFLLSTLIFSAERTYPVIILILILEVFLFLLNRSKANLRNIARRLIILMPIFLIIIFQPGIITHRAYSVLHRMGSYLDRTEFLLVPFISFASTILPTRYWSLILIFLWAFVFTPLMTLFLFKNPLRFLLITLTTLFGGAIITYFLSMNAENFTQFTIIAMGGIYIIGLSIAFLFEWLKIKDQLYIGLSLAPLAAFIFIFSIWLGTEERALIFVDVHRYLTTAAIFTSLFLGSLIVVFYKKFFQNNILKLFLFIPIFLFIFISSISSSEIKNFFNLKSKLGFNFEDKTYMRQKLLPYYQNLSVENPRLIYIDIYFDKYNSNYYGNTINAGSNAWPQWLPNINFRSELVPIIAIDYASLKSSVVEMEGKKGILFKTFFHNSKQEKFIKAENFFAIRLIDGKIIDTTDEIKADLKLK